MSRSTLIHLNPVELNYYPFIINLDKYNRNCIAVDDLSPKICVPSKKKDVNVKLFNIITKINEAKTLIKHISCGWKCKFNSTTCNSDPKLNNEICQCKCRNYRTCTKDHSWNSNTCICGNSKYWKVLLILQ